MAEKQPQHLVPRPFQEVLDEIVYERDAQEVIFTAGRRVECMGADAEMSAALGHPKVFYTIGDKGYAECMYCDRVFVLDPARAGTVYDPALSAPHADQRNPRATTAALTGDGLTEEATPPPGEEL